MGLIEGPYAVNPDAINYPGVALPTFFLPDARTPLNILYGSCRKLHGPEEDSFFAADGIVEKSVNNLLERPSVLFLTGDQIYADDVATPLISHFTELGNVLLGWDFPERIPDIGETKDIPVKQRQRIAQEVVRFTSTHAQNHIFSFGEYAAHYLVSWNAENWPVEDWLTLYPQQEIADYRKEIEEVERALNSLPAVRRVLANIPTYMMFDDHDVTDDWNLTQEWRKNVETSNSGRRVVANALAAFWAFQAWGNDPDMFSSEFIAAITDYLQSEGTDGDKVFERTLWDFPSWTFRAPTDPPTILLDTRTQRDYDSAEGASRLLNTEALTNLKAHTTGTQGKPLIIVSPPPVYGFELMEALQNEIPKYLGPYKFDYEAWRSNIHGFLDFMKFLVRDIRPKYCIFLSGDVHYAFSISATFTFQNHTLPMTQLTSSALKNSGIGSAGATIAGFMTPPQKLHVRRLGWDRRPTSGKQQRLKNDLGAGNVPATRVQATLREIARIEYILIQAPPLVFTPEEATDLEIQERPNWEETRTYIPPSRFLKWPLIPDNNIGLVRMQRGGSQLEHRLYLHKNKNRLETLTTTLDVDPLISLHKP